MIKLLISETNQNSLNSSNDEISSKLKEIRDHWSDPKNYDTEWTNRARLAADMLSGVSSVCDIGCGPGFLLRNLLSDQTKYFPADAHRWNDGVEVCDLSALEFPASAASVEVCCFLGVIEYLPNVEDVFRGISKICDRVVFSYCSTDIDADRWHLWINAYSGPEIGSIVGLSGFRIERCVPYKPGQYLMQATVNRNQG